MLVLFVAFFRETDMPIPNHLTWNKRIESLLLCQSNLFCIVTIRFARSSQWKGSARHLGTSLYLPVTKNATGKNRPWALPKPTRGTFPLDPIQKTPPTPSSFWGGSLAGRQVQTKVWTMPRGFGCAKSVNSLMLIAWICKQTHSIPLTVDRRHAFPSSPCSFKTENPWYIRYIKGFGRFLR